MLILLVNYEDRMLQWARDTLARTRWWNGILLFMVANKIPSNIMSASWALALNWLNTLF